MQTSGLGGTLALAVSLRASSPVDLDLGVATPFFKQDMVGLKRA